MQLNHCKSVAVFRALQLGDLLCSVPAFRALRQAFPTSHIALIGLPWAEAFVKRFNHLFDEFLPFPGFPGLPEQPVNIEATAALIKEVQRRRFDLVLQLQGNGTIVNPLIQILGARRYAGYYPTGHWCPDPETFMPYPDTTNPEVLRHLRLMESLGIPPCSTELEFPLTDNDVKEYEQLRLPVRRYGYVCIHPGARAAERQWNPAHFARLGDLANRNGYEVVLTGVESERGVVAAVAGRMKQRPMDLTGKTSLGALGVLVQNARLVIANDTGISHIADATRTPSLIVSLAHDSERWAALDDRLHPMIRCRGRECLEEAAATAASLLAQRRLSVA